MLLNPQSTPQDCVQAIHELGSSWVKNSLATADTLYGQIPWEDDSNEIRKHIMETYIQKVTASPLTQNKEEEIKEIAEHFNGLLPLMVSTKAGNEDLTTEQQKIAEKHAELEVISANEAPSIKLGEIIEGDDLQQIHPDKFTPEPLSQKIAKIPLIYI